ncbi:MAG: hypothetical protein HYT20_03675 [Candidatus Nealsonbacteria bacterium]|nr:hypothetical protein [Candidatus Nealsonbacteria bacterium]
MFGYATAEREKDLLVRVESLEREWDQFKSFISQKIAEPPEDVPLKRLREFFKSDGPTNWGKFAGRSMVTVSTGVYFFLEHIHKMIMDFNLDVSEDVTVPQALAAAVAKTVKK